jgi:hypothetical protein
MSKELERQIEIATECFRHPNIDDNMASFLEQVIEDYLIGAAAIEMQLQRPSIMLDLGEGYDDDHLLAFRSYWMNEIEGQGKLPIVAGLTSGRADEKSGRGANVMRLYPEGDDGMFLQYQELLIALWRLARDGVVAEGVRLRPAA